MRIFLAGATGAIGSRLLPLLVGAGHEVTGTTRHADRADSIRRAGAEPAIVDGLDGDAVRAAVRQATPEWIIHQLTAIPSRLNVRHFDSEFALTNRLRTAGTDHLLAAAREVACPGFIAQSFAGWPYARTGGWVKTEEDPLTRSPDPGMRETFEAIVHLESTVLEDAKIRGIVLRYGSFYGPGTSLGAGGWLLEEVRRRRMPLVGKGTAYWSFIHIDDAASATLAAVRSAAAGLYNVTDDEPAPVSAWLPFLAKVLGAKPPRRIPAWLGRMAIGRHGVALMNEIRGASNQKARSRLSWTPRWASWRDGFRHGLGP